MSYYISKIIQRPGSFQEIIDRTVTALQAEGFGVLTEIDMQATMKKKLNKDIHPYRILGACNAPYAFKALQAENKIGTMLPCNVIVQQLENGDIEVAAVDPIASMQAVGNQQLAGIADEIRTKLKTVVESL